MKDFLTDEEMMNLEQGSGSSVSTASPATSTPDFIPDDQADSFFGAPKPVQDVKTFRYSISPEEDKKAKMAKYTAEADAAKKEADKYKGFGFVKQFGKELFNTVAGSEVNLGKTIGSIIATHDGTLDSMTNSLSQLEKNRADAIKKIREKEARGEDASADKRFYNSTSDTIQTVQADLDRLIGGTQKTTGQVVGELGGTALDLLSAGTYGNAAKGAKSLKLLPKGSTAPTVVEGVKTLAKKPAGLFTKTGAARVAEGGALGYGYDVSQNLQNGEESAFTPGYGTFIGAGLPGLSGAAGSLKNARSSTNFIEKRAGAFEDLFNSGVGTKNLADRITGKGHDVAKTLAANDRYIPDIAEGKIIPDQAIVNVQEDTKPLAEIIRGVIESENKYIPLDQVKTAALKEIEGLKLRGDEYNRVRNNIEKDFMHYAQEFADAEGRVPLTIIDDIKKAKYGNINWNNPDLLSADRAISKSARRVIEDSVTDASIRDLNAELGKLYDAQEMLEKLGGRVVKGGRLGKYFARGFGIAVGAPGGPLGSIVGGITADKLADLMQSSYFQNPLLKKMVGEIRSARPKIFDDAEKLIAKRKSDQGSRLQLGAPSSMRMPGEAPKESSMFVTNDYNEFLERQGLPRIKKDLPMLPAGNPKNINGPTIIVPEKLQSSVDAREAARRKSGEIKTPKTKPGRPKKSIYNLPRRERRIDLEGQTTSQMNETTQKTNKKPTIDIPEKVPQKKSKVNPFKKKASEKKYSRTLNLNNPDDAAQIERTFSESHVKDFKEGRFDYGRYKNDKAKIEEILGANIVSEDFSKPKLNISKYTGGNTFYHGTIPENLINIQKKGFLKGSDLAEDAHRGGGYGKIQNSISLSSDPDMASRFTGSNSKGALIETKIKPGAKIISVKGVEYAEDLNDYVDDLIKDGVDAVWIGGGENELIVLNPKVLTVSKSRLFDVQKAKEQLKDFRNNQ